ncbi:hypothetical protein NKW54_08645 [Acetobacter cerevisiae]|uniref:Uncharacterized protein n=1 Tax=Acetobacter cerevisiae TaxID=178900 RepID=A0ABT1ERJ4_9PROT|nr:hypothetical protein [Acetobacter cerevisiae]MCP1246007.1 hypothetical protein [Acetobacter cerevisiae]MCP1255725.1 hypothetical protein [Acetobacter cerevisiae]
MTQKTILEMISKYHKGYLGSFCTREGLPVEILTMRDRRGHILGYQGDSNELTTWCENGQFDKSCKSDTPYDLMCAREVPATQELWANEYENGRKEFFPTKEAAGFARTIGFVRTVHFREVLPGEGA